MLVILEQIIMLAILLALLTSFVVLFISKTGVRDNIVQMTKSKLISELFACDFCLCFWISMALCIAAIFVFNSNLLIIFMPFISTPISRVLL